MRAVPILLLLSLVLCAKWVILLSLDTLKDQCKERTSLDLVVGWVKALMGFPDPDPPWWRPTVCEWLKRESKGCRHGKKTRRGEILPRRQKYRGRVKSYNLSSPLPSPPVNNALTKCCMDVAQMTPRFDGYINIDHGQPRGQDRYRELLLGPISTTIKAIRAVIITHLKALGVPEDTVRFTTKMGDGGSPEFLGISTSDIRFAVVLVPDEGINVQLQRVGPARGLIREVAYQTYHVTYRGFVLRDEGTSLLYGST